MCRVRTTHDELMLSTHVDFQMTKLTKSFIAHITFKRFLVRVNTLVPFQITRLTKTLLAHIAFVRFLVRVNTHVAFQMTKLTKSFIANIAFIRFLVRVSTHVFGQLGWTIKHLLANIALVLLRPLSLLSLTRARFFSYLLVLLVSLLHHLRRQVFVVSRVKFSFLMTRIFP